MQKTLYIALLVFISIPAKGQFVQCVDSIRANSIYQCNDPIYDPVCGCNNVTYRNQCTAYNVFGINNWRGGVCAGIDVDFFPNPVGPNSILRVNLSFPEFVMGNADVKIVDVYGKTWEQRIINNFNKMNIQFDMSTIGTGIYMLVVTSNIGGGMVKKFAKY